MSDPLTISLPIDQTLTVVPDAVGSTRRKFLTPLPTPGEFLLVIDNTGLDYIKRCHTAARNYLILGRQAPAKNAALAFGGAIHEGIEAMLLGQDAEAQTQAILRYFTENPTPPDTYRTPPTAIEVMNEYRKQCNPLVHPDYEQEILTDEHGPIVERSFELPLGVIEVNDWVAGQWAPYDGVTGRDRFRFTDEGEITHTFVVRIYIAWSGRIDVLAYCNQHNRIMDHKTSSISGDQFVQAFQLASQTLGYIWAGRQLWPQHNIHGFCLDAIVLESAGATSRAKAGQSILSIGPKGGKSPLSFFRAYFDYDASRIEEWQTSTLDILDDFIHSFVRGRFPLNDKQCFDKYGQCQYHGVCTIDDVAVREKILQSPVFKDVTWNPTAH